MFEREKNVISDWLFNAFRVLMILLTISNMACMWWIQTISDTGMLIFLFVNLVIISTFTISALKTRR